MLPKNDWAHLIPHAGTMCLLDAVLAWDERTIHATSAGHARADNPLRGELGLHYALFFERDTGDPAEQRRTLHATLVCVLSALLVFGMLAWATIPVLRAIGLTVSLGVAFHFCLSILMAPHASES